MFCMNEVRPIEPSLSKSSYPAVELFGSPRSARSILALAASPRFTKTLVASVLTSNVMPDFAKDAAHPGHFGRAQPDIKNFKIGPGKVIAAETHDRENRDPDGGQGSKTPRPQSGKVSPKTFQLVAAGHDFLDTHFLGGSLAAYLTRGRMGRAQPSLNQALIGRASGSPARTGWQSKATARRAAAAPAGPGASSRPGSGPRPRASRRRP